MTRRRLITLFVLFAYGEAPLTPEAVLRVAGEMAERRAAAEPARATRQQPAPDLAPSPPDGPALSQINFSHFERGERFVVVVETSSIVLPPPHVARFAAPAAVQAPVARAIASGPHPRGPPSLPVRSS